MVRDGGKLPCRSWQTFIHKPNGMSCLTGATRLGWYFLLARSIPHPIRDGYLSTEVCIAYTDGGMGVHFINMATVGPTIKPEQPQVLIYERTGGKLKLAAAEGFVPLAASAEQPSIFEHPLDGPMDGHAPLLPADLRHWDLHVWLWKHNPAGVFNSVNPDLKAMTAASVTSRKWHRRHTCTNSEYAQGRKGEYAEGRQCLRALRHSSRLPQYACPSALASGKLNGTCGSGYIGAELFSNSSFRHK